MNKKERDAFQERCKNMSTEELLSATTVHRENYQSDALSAMDRELVSRNVPIDRQQAVEQEIVQQVESRDQRYRGIRGWLIIFILVVAIGSLINLLLGVAGLMQSSDILAFLLMLPSVLIALYGFVAVVLLLRKKPSAPSHAARWMIANFVYGLIVAIIVWTLTRDTSVFIVLPSAIGLLLWLTYLENSKRIAATYGKQSRTTVNKSSECTR